MIRHTFFYISKRQLNTEIEFFLAFVETSRALVVLSSKGRVQVDDRAKLISVFYCTIKSLAGERLTIIKGWDHDDGKQQHWYKNGHP
jgi:hypothetical protein